MDKIKWGVIGCGGIADRRTIPGMLMAKNAELIAVMDRNKTIAMKVAEEYDVAFVCESEEELLKKDIDAVYIATPVFCHKDQAIAAICAGKHVLIEKPVGLNVAEAKELRDIAQRENVKIGVGMMMRFHTHHQAIREMIAEGKLGEIVSMRAQFSCWYPKIEGSWRQIKKLGGGGALMDLGVHCIDILQYITGTKAYGVTAICDTQTFGYEVDDSASVILKMNNGAHAYVDVNFNIPDDVAQSRLEIYGTKGSVIADGTLAQEEVGSVKVSLADMTGYDAMQKREEANSFYLESASGNMYTKEIESFSDSLLNGTGLLVSIEDGIWVQEIAEAAYRSSEEGRYIEFL